MKKNEWKEFEETRLKELRKEDINNKVFKNYSELCKFLKIEEKNVKNKERSRQLKKLEEYMLFTENKDKSYTIIKIYSVDLKLLKNPLSIINKDIEEGLSTEEKRKMLKVEQKKIDKTIEAMTEYSLFTILKSYIANNKVEDTGNELYQYKVAITKKQLARMLGQITAVFEYYNKRQYRVNIDKKEEIEEKIGNKIGRDIIAEFCEKTEDFYKRNIDKVLKNLDHYHIINAKSYEYGVFIEGEVEEWTKYIELSQETQDKEGLRSRVLIQPKTKTRVLTEAEELKIKDVKINTFFDVMGLNYNVQEKDNYLMNLKERKIGIYNILYKNRKIDEYYKEVDRRLLENLRLINQYGIINIGFSKEMVDLNLEKVGSTLLKSSYIEISKKEEIDKMLNDCQIIINELSKEKININAERRYNRRYEKKIEDIKGIEGIIRESYEGTIEELRKEKEEKIKEYEILWELINKKE